MSVHSNLGISRRQMLFGSAAAVGSLPFLNSGMGPDSLNLSKHAYTNLSPTHAIIPIIGDGKWIWKKPPKDKTGYLESRSFDLSIEIHVRGNGPASNFRGFTAAPVAHGEQEILDFDIQTDGCKAEVQKLSDSSARFVMAADTIEAGQWLYAKAIYRLKISKSYFGYNKEKFPRKQTLPKFVTRNFLGNSPGIQTHSGEVKNIVKKIAANIVHPWDKAKKFHEWVFEHIKGKPQKYTSVIHAIRDGVGDCEERAGVFIALCRAAGIPARLVWVPNHSWAEILLFDGDKKPYWIPIHTAAYSWFGWTGAHEVVLQKGDRIKIPEQRKHVRLIYDHYKCLGKRPDVVFTAKLLPIVDENNKDPGPGARHKQKNGQWKIVGDHKDNKYMRP